MKTKSLIFTIVSIIFMACSNNEQVTQTQNLQEYIVANSDRKLDEVIACAASAEENDDLSYVFYYPVDRATDIRYYELGDVNADKNNFALYRRQMLSSEPVFDGKLERFLRHGSTEAWCIVTYLTNGNLHKSNPIRLKNNSQPTDWKEEVNIDFSTSLMPEFRWYDELIEKSSIYFQVISNIDHSFISGTYTVEQKFKYYVLSNVVLHINTHSPPKLVYNQDYNFLLMAVSEDNWVNFVIEKRFTAR